MKATTERLLAAGLLQDFVRDSGGSWSPGDWLGLMLRFNWSGFGQISEARVQRLVTDNREWWLQGKNTLPPKCRTDAPSASSARKKNPRQSRKPK